MRYQFTDAAILVFAKAPVCGQVKTRLIPVLGAEQAARLHARLVEHTLSTVCATGLAPIELWCAPNQTHGFFRSLQEKFALTLHEQQGADLGQRMHHALATALQSRSHAILIGTDCPALEHDYLHQALSALSTEADVVLGPAEDGGYVLVGLRQPVAGIFQDIPWGTATVLAETLARIRALDLQAHLLSEQWDVDRPEDVERLQMLAAEL